MTHQLGAVRQAGYVVRDAEAAMRHWTERLGIGPFFYVERLPLQRFRYRGSESAAQIAVGLGYSGEVQVEFIQPLDDEPSLWRDFLAAGHEGLHHVAFWTEAFDRDLAHLLAGGLTVGHEGRSGSGGPDERFAYLEPSAADGTVIELSEYSGPKADTYRMVYEAARAWDGADPIRTLDGAPWRGGEATA